MRGTLIACEDGNVAIEAIKAGDIVNTLSDGPQVVRWVGKTGLHSAAVSIPAGAMGATEALLVAPAQRMMISDWHAKVLFGETEVLLAAEALLEAGPARLVKKADGFESFHILFDKHEVICANGAASESFYPLKSAINQLAPDAQAALLAQLPELATLDPHRPYDPVRLTISAAEAALLR